MYIVIIANGGIGGKYQYQLEMRSYFAKANQIAPLFSDKLPFILSIPFTKIEFITKENKIARSGGGL